MIMKKYYLLFGVLGVLAFFLYRKFCKKGETAVFMPLAGAETDDPTISVAVARQYAEQLYNAMKDTGTDVGIIENIFGVLSKPADLRLVYNMFGTRAYGTFGSPLYSWFPSSQQDLRGWINKELSGKNLKKWNELFKQIGL